MKNALYFLAAFTFFSCTTEKNSLVHRTFHNLHAKYNGYFNANEIINTTYSTFLNSRTEDYNELLPIYPLPSVSESKNWYSPMDTAAGKCELVIYKHRMPHAKKGRSRNKEWCKWIDDNWMTIGQTKFYKKEFGQALKIFQYVETHYEIENSYYESIFWQAKTYIEMEAYDDAEEILLEIITKSEEQQKVLDAQPFLASINSKFKSYIPKSKKKLKFKEKWKVKTNYDERIKYLEDQELKIPQKIIDHVYPTLADLYLKSGEEDKAVESLELALNRKYKKVFKTRLIFILAQLYHKEGNYKASTYYQWVVNRNPEYDMAFQAKINRALSFSGGDAKAIKAQLLKMLDDDKNIDYFDQIYFALAEIAFTENNEPLALDYLKTSVSVSKKNKKQKTKSLQKLGDWNYSNEDYMLAYQYYDTIQQVWKNDSIAKQSTIKRYTVLANIYSNTKTINDNDSLINICALSADEKRKKLFDVVDFLEQQKELQESTALTASANNRLGTPKNLGIFTQTMFFWDETMLNRGKANFESKWGARKLEDNWRRSSKKSSLIDEEIDEEIDQENNELFEELMAGLPCEDSSRLNQMKEASLEAMFNLGLIHHYETGNLKKATYYFKQIVANYQPMEMAIASVYELYLIHEELNNTREHAEMKELLMTKYPRSKYAKLLTNTLDTADKKYQEENLKYKNLYHHYSNGDFQLAYERAVEAVKDSLNPLFCSYNLLMAYSFAKLPELDDTTHTLLIEVLKKTVEKCMGTVQGNQAYEILKTLKVFNANNALEKQKWKFAYSPDTVHYFILFSPKDDFDINKAKIAVADFNSASFSANNLKTSNKFLNTSDQMILVKSFPNANKAMDYYLAFQVNNGRIKNYRDKTYFVLSPNNLKELYLEKNIDNYTQFFKEFYL